MADLGIVIAERLLEVIGSAVIKEICDTWGYKTQLKDLNETVNTVKNVLLDAESKRELTPSQQGYINKLKAVVYDADDLFDEFFTLAELKQLDHHKDHKFLKKVCCFLCSNTKRVGQAYDMSRKVKEIKKQLQFVVTEHKKYELSSNTGSATQKPNRQERETYSYLNKKDIVGRDEDIKNVIDLMLSPDIEEDVRFVTIVGAGGVGKTTLAKLVYQDNLIQNEFPLRLWVSVSDQDSEQFDLQSILCRILELLLGDKQVDNTWSMELVQHKFKEHVNGDKYLLVLDDVWNENRNKWSHLEDLLMSGQRGSRILLTTRSGNTSTIIKNNVAYMLNGLSETDSWNLFETIALPNKGPNHVDNHEFIELGKSIVKKCHSIPLAIKVVGSLLYGKDISNWRSFEESKLLEIRNVDKEIMSILKFSYHYLESSLKSCFSYCALFPKNFEIDRVRLISLWMAQGYIIPFDGGQSLEDAAEEHFNTLLQRCFFQNVKEDVYGNVKSVTIHDLMHDVAQDVGKQEIWVFNSGSSTLGDRVRHVCHVGGIQPPESCVFKNNIRSLVCSFDEKLLMKSHIIDSWTCLRVLDLESSHFKTLPDWIGNLVHLRYLNLSNNFDLETLPNSITKLYNLQTLIVFYCFKLRKLPKELGKLVNLRHLDLNNCYGLNGMPPGMEKLCNLRVMPYFVVGNGSEEHCDGELEMLESFTNITGNICIEIGPNYEKVEGGVGYLKSKKYLTTLKVVFHDPFQHVVDHEAVLEKLEPNSNLKGIILEGFRGKVIPRWGTTQTNWAISFPYLVNIKLDCLTLEQLPSLSKLRYLKSLVLEGIELEYVEGTSKMMNNGSDGYDQATFFPTLEYLKIGFMRRLKGWWRGEDDILSGSIICPRLSHLTMHNCTSLTPMKINMLEEKGDSVASSANIEVKGLENLEIDKFDYLNSIFVYRLSRIPWKSPNDSLRSLTLEHLTDTQLPNVLFGALSLTSLHTLKFHSCLFLQSLPEWVGNLSSLQSLSISICYALKSLPESMSKLTSLRSLKISLCPQLVEICQPDGEDWIKIQHIPNIVIDSDSINFDEMESM